MKKQQKVSNCSQDNYDEARAIVEANVLAIRAMMTKPKVSTDKPALSKKAAAKPVLKKESSKRTPKRLDG